MREPVELTQNCPKCDGHFKFPAEGAGMEVNCPLCDLIIKLEGKPDSETPKVSGGPGEEEQSGKPAAMISAWWPQSIILSLHMAWLIGAFVTTHLVLGLASPGNIWSIVFGEVAKGVAILAAILGLRYAIFLRGRPDVSTEIPSLGTKSIRDWVIANKRTARNICLLACVAMIITSDNTRTMSLRAFGEAMSVREDRRELENRQVVSGLGAVIEGIIRSDGKENMGTWDALHRGVGRHTQYAEAENGLDDKEKGFLDLSRRYAFATQVVDITMLALLLAALFLHEMGNLSICKRVWIPAWAITLFRHTEGKKWVMHTSVGISLLSVGILFFIGPNSIGTPGHVLLIPALAIIPVTNGLNHLLRREERANWPAAVVSFLYGMFLVAILPLIGVAYGILWLSLLVRGVLGRANDPVGSSA